MTLTKTKPRKASPAHRKRTAAHHQHSHRYKQTYWPYLPIVAIMLFGLVLNSWIGSAGRNVLGYATNMSVAGLHSGTNAERNANNLGSLALSATLNQAAQNKANDMVTRDYWSHNTPDGQAPWTFITAVGYSYQTAGENLAYGFTASADTITGWMNSPGHRANILNTSFSEVGFGIANSPNYVGNGPQTVVVAMYALPIGASPPAAPTPAPTPTSTPAPTPTPTPTPSASGSSGGGAAQPTPTAEATPTPTPEPTAAAPVTKQGDTDTVAKSADKVVTEKTVPRLHTISTTNVAWSQFAVSMIAAIALLAFLLRHSFAWHKVLVKGEKFILHHPFLDIVFVAVATLGFILLQSSGTIR